MHYMRRSIGDRNQATSILMHNIETGPMSKCHANHAVPVNDIHSQIPDANDISFQ